MNNKGATNQILGVAMAAILILIISFFVWQTSKALTGFGVEQECKSVLTTGGIMQFLNPNAPIKSALPSQQFEDDISLCPVNAIRYKARTSPELINKDIANEMISCYQKYGGGDVNLFEQAPGRNLYCVMCTYIEFDESVPGPVDGLIDYMNEEEISGLGVTYSEFLAGATTTKSASGIEIPAQNEIIIDTNQDYAVYFIYGKAKDFWSDQLGNNIKSSVVGTVGGTALGIGVVAVAGTGAVLSAVIVVPIVLVATTVGFFSGPEAVPDQYDGMVMLAQYDSEIIRQFQCTTYGAKT